MAEVPETERANGGVGCYGKGQSILVENTKKSEVGEIRNEIAQNGKAAKNLVKNSEMYHLCDK